MSALRSKALVAATLSLATTATAFAGGYTTPVVEPVVAPIVDAAPADWQGGYAGLTLGYAFKGKDDVGVGGGPVPSVTPDKLDLSGANAGVHVGYRWQRGNWVVGPELSYEGGNIKDSFSTGGYDASSKVKNMYALRLKTGYTVSPDMLVYGIAGVGRAKIDYSVVGGGADIKDSYNKTGYILGLGVEKQINAKWSVTGEYEYADFGSENLSDGTYDTNATPQYNNIKLGVNFKF